MNSSGRKQPLTCLALVISLAAASGFAESAPDSKRAPAPTAKQQAAAEKTIKDVFRDDYAKQTPAGKMQLATKLRKQADDSKDDPTSHFVLLTESRDLAASIGDISGALDAEDALAESFEVDEAAQVIPLLEKTAPGVGADNAGDFVSIALKISQKSIGAEQWDRAAKVQALAKTVLRKHPNKDQTAQLKRQTDRMTRVRADAIRFQTAEKKLMSAPDDPAANLIDGKYRCFVKNDWAHGLAALAKSADATLKLLADKDLAATTGTPAGTTSTASDEQLGDAWWEFAQSPAGAADADDARHRAGYWYARALSKLAGLKKSAVETRLAEIRKSSGDSDEANDAFDKLNRRLKTLREWTIISGQWEQLPSGISGKGDSRATFNREMPADFTLTFKLNVVEGVRPRIHFGDIYFGNEGSDKSLWVFGAVNGPVKGKGLPYENNKTMAAKFIFVDSRFEFWIDGKQVCSGSRSGHSSPKLEFSGGDGFSPGKTTFADFRVSPPPAE